MQQTLDVVCFDGPHDGTERTVEHPIPSCLAFRESLSIYRLSANNAKDGRRIYVYDMDGSLKVRERWVAVHGH